MNKTKLQQIRQNAINGILSILKSHSVTEVYAIDICEGSSPVVREDTIEENNTQTLDHIRVENGKLFFSASSCWENSDYNEQTISTDALIDIYEWLEENQDELS